MYVKVLIQSYTNIKLIRLEGIFSQLKMKTPTISSLIQNDHTISSYTYYIQYGISFNEFHLNFIRKLTELFFTLFYKSFLLLSMEEIGV